MTPLRWRALAAAVLIVGSAACYVTLPRAFAHTHLDGKWSTAAGGPRLSVLLTEHATGSILGTGTFTEWTESTAGIPLRIDGHHLEHFVGLALSPWPDEVWVADLRLDGDRLDGELVRFGKPSLRMTLIRQ